MKISTLGTLALLMISAVLVPAASASGGWDCRGDPHVVEVCTARQLQWPYDCFLELTYLEGNPNSGSQGFCYLL
jgi:hypothetical protein